MLINLLIAMMGDTYTRIAEIKNEWIRQVKICIYEIWLKKYLSNISMIKNKFLVGKNGTDCGAGNSTKRKVATTRSICRTHVNWCESINIKAKHVCK